MSLMVMFTAPNAIPRLKDIGMNSSEGVFQNGEWWRIFTVIALHADLTHLSGNPLGIVLFTYLGCRYMGNGFALFLIVLVASFSKLTNAYSRLGEPFFSLGASTAVFAALGLWAGFPVGTFLKTRYPMQNRDWLIPFSGGCILFAWMGGGEFPEDVMGHVLSFAFGNLVGNGIAGTSIPSKLDALNQKALLLTSCGLIAYGWWLALR